MLDHLVYNDINDMHGFLQKMNSCVSEAYYMDILDITLRGNPARWWETHKYDKPD